MAFLVIRRPGQEEESVLLTDAEAVVGRLSDNNIVVDDRLVSRRHAVISPVGEGHTLRDLGSRNGTWVNGRKIGEEPISLHPGDQIALGRYGVVLAYYTDETTVTESSGMPPWVGALGIGESWIESKKLLRVVRVTPWLRLLAAAIGVVAGLLAVVWWIIRFAND